MRNLKIYNHYSINIKLYYAKKNKMKLDEFLKNNSFIIYKKVVKEYDFSYSHHLVMNKT